MLYLVAASLLWAASFGLIKVHLAGVDPLGVAAARLWLSLALFSPWLFRGRAGLRRAGLAMALGSVGYGAMYVAYIASFATLPAWAVALFTTFTPLYVTVLEDVLARRWRWRHGAAAALAVAGAGVALTRGFTGTGAWRGIALVQVANLCFALGQVGYRRLPGWSRGKPGGGPAAAAEAALTGWMYAGATAVSALAAVGFADRAALSVDRSAALVVLYLGVVPTGIGFYLWNRGTLRVGPGTLAVANNLKVPLGVACSWLLFGESADYLRVSLGLGVMVAALVLAGDRGETAAGGPRQPGAGPGRGPVAPDP